MYLSSPLERARAGARVLFLFSIFSFVALCAAATAPTTAMPVLSTRLLQGSGESGPTPREQIALDLYAIIDQSRSISTFNNQCQNKAGMDCWALFVRFARTLTERLAEVAGGYGDEALRVNYLTFSW